MEIRRATQSDAAAMCQVVIASITDLCTDDHHNDPHLLGLWLANKTPEVVAGWIANAANINLVAVDQQPVIAAGCVTSTGVIVLNYVAPTHRFRGVSSAMLGRLEGIARQLGHVVCSLESTSTAHSFYSHHGYTDDGPSKGSFGLLTYPMRKRL